MKIEANCKFCRKALTLEVEETYVAIGDYMKLLPKAACNHCADLRERKRGLEERLQMICSWATQRRQGRIIDENAQKAVRALCEDYSKLVAKWYGLGGMDWDESFPAAIIGAPDQWYEAIRNYWGIFRRAHPLTLGL